MLFVTQHEKCAWCERNTDFSSAPVEHYRPKDGAWRHLPGAALHIEPEHYWWLTWTWTNLLFSCARCNDRGHKANYFPVRAGTTAAAPAGPLSFPLPTPVVDVSSEEPLLVDPAGTQDPLDHITWAPGNKTFNRRDWTWTAFGITDQGDATVSILNLNELADRLQGHVRSRLLPSIEEVEKHLDQGRRTDAHKRWAQLLSDTLATTAELSAFTWCALDHLIPPPFRSLHGLSEPLKPGAR